MEDKPPEDLKKKICEILEIEESQTWSEIIDEIRTIKNIASDYLDDG